MKPNFTIENIKKIAVVHFYGQDTTKPVSSYRLVHSSKFKQLVDENYVDDENVNEYGIIICIKLYIYGFDNIISSMEFQFELLNAYLHINLIQ